VGAIGLAALGFYAWVKAAWALGSTIGIRDVAEWERVFGELPDFERWLALEGTVVLALLGAILLLLILADERTPLGRGGWRRLIRGAGWIAAVPLGLYAVLALVVTVAQVVSGEPSPLAPWVSFGVYLAFLAYAATLVIANRVTARR